MVLVRATRSHRYGHGDGANGDFSDHQGGGSSSVSRAARTNKFRKLGFIEYKGETEDSAIVAQRDSEGVETGG